MTRSVGRISLEDYTVNMEDAVMSITPQHIGDTPPPSSFTPLYQSPVGVTNAMYSIFLAQRKP